MLSQLPTMLLFCLAGAITPGPVNIIATSAAANHGIARALPHVLGATFAYTVIVLALGLGLASAMPLLEQFALLIQLAGAVYLTVMAWRIATSSSEGQAIDSATAPDFLDGALCQWLNPKAWLFGLSGNALFVAANQAPANATLIFAFAAFTMCFIGVGSWALAGGAITGLLSSHRRRQLFNYLMAALLVSTVFSMLLMDF